MKQLSLVMLVALLCTSCWKIRNRPPGGVYRDVKVMGYKAVYSTDPALARIYTGDTIGVKNAGKIYTIGNLIFQNEIGLGLHVFDYSNAAQPKKAGFIHIPGNTEVSVKGEFLYANSYGDLVVVNIKDWKNASEAKRVKDAFSKGREIGYTFTIPPPEHKVYYECGMMPKGIQTGWVKDSVPSYSCYYQ
ncbi:MAG TPA: hypothetical protein VM935_16085 [Chitinophagaceae bacterium]|nr:hypothetical protein [Chitinophagaceae bacterium]